MPKTGALYVGSFDPVTYGHLDIIRRAAKIFGSLTVLVMQNGAKKNLFTVQERMDFLRQAVADIPQVTLASAEGLAADYAQKNQISVFVRGIRGGQDVESEMAQQYYNRLFAPGVETVFLPADEKYRYVSSSAAREVARCGGKLETLVPPFVAQALCQKYR